jgi:hypothetical protein
MEQVKQLLRDYLAGKMRSQTFVRQYSALFRQLKDEAAQAVQNVPGLKKQLDDLCAAFDKGKLSQRTFDENCQRLVAQIGDVTLKPCSMEEDILTHLRIETEAYRRDPAERLEGWHVGGDELRAEVKKALILLG